MSDVSYSLSLGDSPWFVGYSIEKDEMFMFKVDSDDIGWVYYRRGLDASGPVEFFDFKNVQWLGEL